MYNQEFCIPRVKNGFSNKYIETVFGKLQIGLIEKVICLPLKYDNNYKRVIIKVNTESVKKADVLTYITNEIDNNKYFKLVHDFPEYWRVYLNLPQKQR